MRVDAGAMPGRRSGGSRRDALRWLAGLASTLAVRTSSRAAMNRSSTVAETASTGLARRLMPALMAATTQDRNAVMSPASLQSALALLGLGAGGASERALGQLLGLPAGNSFDRAAAALCDVGPLARGARAIWARQGVSWQRAYQEQAERLCQAEVKLLPAAGAAAEVNAWVSRKTQGRIPRVVEQLDAGVRLALVDTLYMLARWQHPFAHGDTRPGLFHVAPDRSMTLPFMRCEGQFQHRSTPRFEWIRLPYAGAACCMDIVLPQAGVAPAAVLDALLDAGGPPAAPAASSRGTLKLPRFTLAEAVALRPLLMALGLREIFDPAAADFSRMAEGAQALAVDDIRQSIYLAVDEAGTEAAAATAVTLVGALPDPAPAFEMTVDRPFLLCIRELNAGAILFLALVRKPGG